MEKEVKDDDEIIDEVDDVDGLFEGLTSTSE